MASTKLARRRDAWQVRLSLKFRRMVAAQKSAAIFVLRRIRNGSFSKIRSFSTISRRVTCTIRSRAARLGRVALPRLTEAAFPGGLTPVLNSDGYIKWK